MQKAKNFWNDVDRYKVDTVSQEILRQQVKEEARALHARVCKWHVRIFHERKFNGYYHYPATPALLKEVYYQMTLILMRRGEIFMTK